MREARACVGEEHPEGGCTGAGGPRGPTLKVRNSGSKEIPLVQGKEQWLCFAGAAVKRDPMPKVRKTQIRW